MNFAEFTDFLCKHILDDWREGATIETQEVKKNNGTTYTGILVYEDSSKVSPMIYIDSLFEDYDRGLKTLDEVIKEFQDKYDELVSGTPASMDVDISNFDAIKDNIFFRVINYEKNQELLNNCPWFPVLDLAMTFRWAAEITENGIASALITHEIMNAWGIQPQDILDEAVKNTERLLPGEVFEITEMAGFEGSSHVYVCTNTLHTNGAGAMFYEGVLADFAKEHPGNYYILPSNIDGVVMLKDDGERNLSQLASFLKNVNRYGINPDDYLSDSIYYYNSETDKITIAYEA